MTTYVTQYHRTRAVVPVYVEDEALRDPNGFLEPAECIPDTKLRSTLLIDVEFDLWNAKARDLDAKIKELLALLDECSKAEEEGPYVCSEGEGPYTSKSLTLTNVGRSEHLVLRQ